MMYFIVASESQIRLESLSENNIRETMSPDEPYLFVCFEKFMFV